MSRSESLQELSDDLTPGPRHAAVGIPQGLIVDPETGEVAGAVRRGGELVSLEPAAYGIWSALLTPLTAAASAELATASRLGDPAPVIKLLESLNLLISIDPEKPMSSALSRLRAIPLGCSLGNVNGDPMVFDIQNAELTRSSPLSLDVVAIMFWWEFDGTTTLQEAVSAITSRVPDLPPHRASVVAAYLAYELMRNRMLYLDTPRTARS